MCVTQQCHRHDQGHEESKRSQYGNTPQKTFSCKDEETQIPEQLLLLMNMNFNEPNKFLNLRNYYVPNTRCYEGTKMNRSPNIITCWGSVFTAENLVKQDSKFSTQFQQSVNTRNIENWLSHITTPYWRPNYTVYDTSEFWELCEKINKSWKAVSGLQWAARWALKGTCGISKEGLWTAHTEPGFSSSAMESRSWRSQYFLNFQNFHETTLHHNLP